LGFLGGDTLELDYFDLISGKPIYFEGVGHIKSPLLEDIRSLTGYNGYRSLLNLLSLDSYGFFNILKHDDNLSFVLQNIEQENNTLFDLIICDEKTREIYDNIFSFFIIENVSFDSASKSYYTWIERYNEELEQNQRILIGVINNDNFINLQSALLQINGLKNIENKPKKYRNEAARLLAEKINKHKEEVSKKQNKEQLSFGSMISKYCADNKNGINILNVWDMTIYQFYDQFDQHNYIRQTYIQDMIYTNTVSFSDLKSYDSQLWLKNNKQ
jgi:hypothetical protein